MKEYTKRDSCMTMEEVIERNTGMSLKAFLTPQPNPYIHNMDRAVEFFKKKVNDAAEEKEILQIKIVGDYDADGMNASAILYDAIISYLKANSLAEYAEVSVRLPRRYSEGYGLSKKIIDESESGLIITVDNGIAAIDAIKKAKDKGIDVIILDHHLSGEELPCADIIVDPHCEGMSTFKHYCGAGLAYRFAEMLITRVSEGGVFSIVQDVPKFSVPARMQGDIYMGTILNPERFTFEHGYRTAFDYRIDENNLMHGFFTGASRSGKTVAAMRFIAELSKIRRKKTGKRLRIVVMDPKQDWRTLARFVEPERFNFYSMGNPNFNPIHINPWKVPHGVNPQVWIDGVIDIYCRAYGLLERGKQMIADVVYELYKENGVFDVSGSDSESKDLVAELSSRVNFQSIYRRMEEKRDKLTGAGKSGNDTKDAYARLIERLSCFSREYSIESKLYGSSEGIAIDDLIGADEVTVLESKGLENTFKNFIFGVITSGFFKFALAHEGGYLADDQYETVLVLEEANEVLTGNDCAGTGGGQNFGMSGQSEFEQILDQSAGYGLFIFAITQKIADMPSSVIANSGLVFAGRLKRTDDINVVVRTVGREERIDDRDLVKWFPRSPTGWFVCQTSRTFDFKDAEPILVQISRLNINPPSNIELDEILIQKKAKTIMSA